MITKKMKFNIGICIYIYAYMLYEEKVSVTQEAP